MRSTDRVKMIQAIRDLAQFLEDHPELPTPNSCGAQYSLSGASPEHEGVVRDVAAMLGDKAQVTINGETAYVRYELSAYPESVDYAVHGFLTEEAAKS